MVVGIRGDHRLRYDKSMDIGLVEAPATPYFVAHKATGTKQPIHRGSAYAEQLSGFFECKQHIVLSKTLDDHSILTISKHRVRAFGLRHQAATAW